MYLRRLQECDPFLGGDRTLLRELLHPEKSPLDLRYSLAHATLEPGRTSLKHRLKVSEVYYVLEGEGVMWIDGESRAVSVGDAVYIPPGSTQSIRNRGEGCLRFLCIVDPAWRPELEEVEGGDPDGQGRG